MLVLIFALLGSGQVKLHRFLWPLLFIEMTLLLHRLPFAQWLMRGQRTSCVSIGFYSLALDPYMVSLTLAPQTAKCPPIQKVLLIHFVQCGGPHGLTNLCLMDLRCVICNVIVTTLQWRQFILKWGWGEARLRGPGACPHRKKKIRNKAQIWHFVKF